MKKNPLIAIALATILAAQAPSVYAQTAEERGASGAELLGKRAPRADVDEDNQEEREEGGKKRSFGRGFRSWGGMTLRGIGHVGTAVGSGVVGVAYGTLKFGNGVFRGATNDDAKKKESEARRAETDALIEQAAAEGQPLTAREKLGLHVRDAKKDAPRYIAKGTVGVTSALVGKDAALGVMGGSALTQLVTQLGTGIGVANFALCATEMVHKSQREKDGLKEGSQIEEYCKTDRKLAHAIVSKSGQWGDQGGKSVGRGLRKFFGDLRDIYRSGSDREDKKKAPAEESPATEEQGQELAGPAPAYVSDVAKAKADLPIGSELPVDAATAAAGS
jgi:hypothetical protein